MQALTAYVIEQLRASREELLAIANDELAGERINEWRAKYWELALVPASDCPVTSIFATRLFLLSRQFPNRLRYPSYKTCARE
jgi:hypothetical protein